MTYPTWERLHLVTSLNFNSMLDMSLWSFEDTGVRYFTRATPVAVENKWLRRRSVRRKDCHAKHYLWLHMMYYDPCFWSIPNHQHTPIKSSIPITLTSNSATVFHCHSSSTFIAQSCGRFLNTTPSFLGFWYRIKWSKCASVSEKSPRLGMQQSCLICFS